VGYSKGSNAHKKTLKDRILFRRKLSNSIVKVIVTREIS